MPRSLVALGSNLGDRAAHIAAAVDALAHLPAISNLRVGSHHETAPIGGQSGQAPFLNAAATFETELSAVDIHAALQAIERSQGRTRAARWDARTLDLDLLLYGDSIVDTPDLQVPHPRMAFRHFVLAPAAEVAPDMVHPRIGWTIAQLLAHLQTARPYVAIAGPSGRARTALAGRLANEFQARLIVGPPELSGGEPAETATGPSLERLLEFQHEQTEALQKDRWPAGNQLAVSDFWFDQLLLEARLRFSKQVLGEFGRRFKQATAEVVLPKLLVVLDTPRSKGTSEATTENQASSQPPLAVYLQQLAERPGVGPVLFAPADPESQFQEVSAAIRAMQPASDPL
jgi:2-amino-4-hydroxy-6-hydroxymethyldihydropteridine diphosphokinase